MKALVASNCVTTSLTQGLQALFPDWTVKGAQIDVADQWLLAGEKPEFADYLSQIDIVVGLPLGKSEVAKRLPATARRVTVPYFAFRGLQPDAIHLPGRESVLARGNLFSRIATVAFLSGRTEQEAAAAFRGDVYERLGYFDLFEQDKTTLLGTFAAAGLDLSDAFPKWTARRTPFLYSYNHPVGFVIDDILVRLGQVIDGKPKAVPAGLKDLLAVTATWPVYPEIAERYGIESPFVWRKGAAAGYETMDLSTFIGRTYEVLRNGPPVDTTKIQNYEAVVEALSA